jgi:hypothetical protein
VRGSGNPGRALIAILGMLAAIGGLALIGTGNASAGSGLWLLIVGIALIIASVIERLRYRSETADLSGASIGPGGGEPRGEQLEARFERTDEAFIDPTSGHRMRVWLDRRTGERRYRADD